MTSDAFNIGGNVIPFETTPDVGSSLLSRCDHFCFQSIPYIKYMLNKEFGSSLYAVLKNVVKSTDSACFETCNINPKPFLESLTHKFPLLAIYHYQGSLSERTQKRILDKRKYNLCYVLPPVTYDQAKAAFPLLTALPATIEYWLLKGQSDDYNGGKPIFDDSELGKISVEYEVGFADWSNASKSSYFPMLEMDLMVEVIQGHNTSGLPLYQGAEASVDAGDDDNGNFEDVAIIDTEIS